MDSKTASYFFRHILLLLLTIIITTATAAATAAAIVSSNNTTGSSTNRNETTATQAHSVLTARHGRSFIDKHFYHQEQHAALSINKNHHIPLLQARHLLPNDNNNYWQGNINRPTRALGIVRGGDAESSSSLGARIIWPMNAGKTVAADDIPPPPVFQCPENIYNRNRNDEGGEGSSDSTDVAQLLPVRACYRTTNPRQPIARVELSASYRSGKQSQQRRHYDLVPHLRYAGQYISNADVTALFYIGGKRGDELFYTGRRMMPAQKVLVRIYFDSQIRGTPCMYPNIIDIKLSCGHDDSLLPASSSSSSSIPVEQQQQQQSADIDENNNDNVQEEQQQSAEQQTHHNMKSNIIVRNMLESKNSNHDHEPELEEIDIRLLNSNVGNNNKNEQLQQHSTINNQPVAKRKFSSPAAAAAIVDDEHTAFFRQQRRQPAAQQQQKQQLKADAEQLYSERQWNLDSIRTRPYMREYRSKNPQLALPDLADAASLIARAFAYGYDNTAAVAADTPLTMSSYLAETQRYNKNHGASKE